MTFWIVVLVIVLWSGMSERAKLRRRIEFLEQRRTALLKHGSVTEVVDAELLDERGRPIR